MILKALFITLVCELFVMFLFERKNKKMILTCLILNIILNPLMNVVLRFIPVYYNFVLYSFEVIVVVIEGLVYYKILKKLPRAMIISFICNLVSYFIGILVL